MSITAADLQVRRVGEPAIHSPMARLLRGRASSPHYVHESDRQPERFGLWPFEACEHG